MQCIYWLFTVTNCGSSNQILYNNLKNIYFSFFVYHFIFCFSRGHYTNMHTYVFCSGVHLQTERCEQAEGLSNAQQQYHWGRGHGNPTGPARRSHSTQPAAPLHTEEHICEQTPTKITHTFTITFFVHQACIVTNDCVCASV